MSQQPAPQNAVVLYSGPERSPKATGQIQVAAKQLVEPVWIADPMTAAITWLNAAGIPHHRASEHQLKVLGNINFYPRKGTINLDNQRRMLWRGLPGLRDVLKRRLCCDLPPVPRTRWGS